MIEVIVLSTAVAWVEIIPRSPMGTEHTRCRAFQEVVESTMTAEPCLKAWRTYLKNRKEWCIKYPPMGCGSLDSYDSGCGPERVVLSRKLVGLCDDGVVRWKEVKR